MRMQFKQARDLKLKREKLLKPVQSIKKYISQVFWPFHFTIARRNINVFLINEHPMYGELFADWELYKLSLFNVFQNAVKFNQIEDGEIVIIQSIKPKRVRFEHFKKLRKNSSNPLGTPISDKKEDKEDFKYVLETEIIDTGVGIPPDK